MAPNANSTEKLFEDQQRSLKATLAEVARLKSKVEFLAQQVKLTSASGLDREAEYFSTYHALVEIQISQLEGHLKRGIDKAPSAADLALVQWQQALSTAKRLRMNRLIGERLVALIEADLEAAASGQEPAEHLPAAWLKCRPTMEKVSDWVEALRNFQTGFAAFADREAEIQGAIAHLQSQPLVPAHFDALKQLNMPALNGDLYRLRSPFLRLEQGEQFLDSLAFEPMLNA